jgi:hypothetical protein
MNNIHYIKKEVDKIQYNKITLFLEFCIYKFNIAKIPFLLMLLHQSISFKKYYHVL